MDRKEKSDENREELLEQLQAADERYRRELEAAEEQGTLKQDKLEYELPSDEEINAAAEREGQRYYEENAARTNEKYDAQGKELNALAESRREQAELADRRIEESYRERRQDAEAQALARGLGRSSIIMGQIEAFDRGKIEDRNQLYADYADELSRITAEINSLEARRTAELNGLEYDRAGVTEDKLRALKEERDEKLAEMIKYNNAISEKQQKYADSKGGLTEEKARALRESSEREKYAIAKRYLDGLTAAGAFETLVSDSRYRELLGDYFTYLLNYYRKRL